MEKLMREDLSNCDREQIHLVGSTQEHGYFLAFRPSDRTIYHVSSNINALFNGTPQDLVGKGLETLFNKQDTEIILKRARQLSLGQGHYMRLRVTDVNDVDFDGFLFELEGLVGLELEPRKLAEVLDEEKVDSKKINQNFVEHLHSAESLLEMGKLVCKTVRSLIGFERVMMYRYLGNWDGEVMAEDKSAESHSFLHHRFPASDIPLPARQLYLKNRTRLILSSVKKPIPIWPQDHYLTRKPLDLSHSKLRAVSPIHLEYLRNMGVVSSFSVAIIVEGSLWGLIACHNSEEKWINHEIRSACETVASTFAVVAQIKDTSVSQLQKIKFEEQLRSVFHKVMKAPALVSALFKYHVQVQELFSATGMALIGHQGFQIAGLTPPEKNLKEISQWFLERFRSENKTVLTVESLLNEDARFQDIKDIACGALAVLAEDETMFILFRPELLRNITWGGDPRKILDRRNYQGVLNPRASFESWNETVSGHGDPWLPHEIRGAEFFRDFLFNNLVKKERLIEELGRKLKIT